jgi:hypothetical protein
VPPEFEEAIEGGAIDLARSMLASSVGKAATGMQARLCLALLAAGRRLEADELLQSLAAAWQQGRDPVAGEAMAQWYSATSNAPMATELAELVVAIASDRVACWRVLVDRGAVEDRRKLATRLQAAASAQASTWRRAELLAELVVLTATWDAAGAIDLLLAARHAGIGQDESIAALMRAVTLGANAPDLLAAARRAALPSAVREALERDVRRATVSEAEMVAVLAAHVRIVVARCRAVGTTPVLFGYPFPAPRQEAALQHVAGELGIPFVSTVAAFGAQMAGDPRADWFVDEIHCTARGYAFLAKLAADSVVSLSLR